ncbi:hypothetical protein PRNP1_013010 [Phytophthora ramorum]
MIAPVKCLVASAMAVTVVNGHGYMTKPAATFSAEAGDKTQFIATIDSSTSGLKGTFNTAPADNVASFTKAFASSKYKSLKALIDDKAKVTVTGATLTCGTADPAAAAQALPKTVEWSHSESEGFTASHEGPCEVCGATQQTGSASTTTTDSSSADTPTVTSAPSSGGSPSTTAGSSSDTPTVTSAPSSGGSPSTNASPSTPAAQTPSTPSTTTAPSTNSSPSTSTTSAPSATTTDDSECGSYDIAGDDTQDTGSQANTYQESQTNTYQGSSTGTQSQTNTNQGSSTGTQSQTNTNQWSNTGTGTTGNTNQWSGSNGGNTNQWSNTDTTQTSNGYNQNQNTGTGSQTSFNFNNFKGPTNTGTVSPQSM